MNDHLVLLAGPAASGKSLSLRNLDNPEGVMYLNTESNKKLPFPSKFKEFGIIDPEQVKEAFQEAENMPDVHTIVVDSLTYLMDMYESQYVLTAPDSRRAWGNYAQFFKTLMQQYVASSTKNVIFTAHTVTEVNDEMVRDVFVKVKGALMNTGIESYFSCVLASKKMPLKTIKDFLEECSPPASGDEEQDDPTNSLLTTNDEEEMLGIKYVFQTRLTRDTVNERIRSPLNMWAIPETYIDNDLQNVINRLHQYYT